MGQYERFEEAVVNFQKQYRSAFTLSSELTLSYGSRSVSEIKRSGEIDFLNCLERHLVIAHEAAQLGIKGNYVAFGAGRRYLCLTKLSSGLELELDGEPYYFVSANSRGESIRPGFAKKRDTHTPHYLLPFDQINSDSSWIDNYENAGIDLSELRDAINPKLALSLLKLRNSQRLFERYQRQRQRRQFGIRKILSE